ncbi:MAG: RluA family pseudouridine synthase [bacterium]
MEHKFQAGSGDAGQRLDTWLCQKIPALSRKQVKALLDGGCVQINGRRVVIAGWEVELEDEVSVLVPQDFESRNAEGEAEAAAPAAGAREPREPQAHRGKRVAISASIERHIERRRGDRGRKGREAERRENAPQPPRLKVYYEDRDLIIVEKPGGMLSVPREGGEEKGTLIGLIRAYLRRRYQKGKQSFVAPLHRLDAETSGIMVFALSKTGQNLTQQFKSHSIQRSYEAVVLGAVDREQGVIDKPLEKGEFGGGRKVREAEGDSGKRAITEYRVKERYKDASLLDVSVRTGRTHQIRVHLAGEGHPILGDALYAEQAKTGHDEVMDEVDKHLGFRRHALHAAVLGFRHPSGGKKVHYRSPLPQDMKDIIDAFRSA